MNRARTFRAFCHVLGLPHKLRLVFTGCTFLNEQTRFNHAEEFTEPHRINMALAVVAIRRSLD